MRTVALLSLALALSSCAGGPRNDGQRLERFANPGQVVAADRAFARALNGAEGVNRLGELAPKDALVILASGVVSVQDWIRSPSDALSIDRQAGRVFSSCDGSLAVVRGRYGVMDGEAGKYVTVWQRQRGGEYKWKLDMAWADPSAREAPDMIGTKIADCSEVLESDLWGIESDDGEVWREGISADESLGWRLHYGSAEGRELLVDLWTDGSMSEVIAVKLPASK